MIPSVGIQDIAVIKPVHKPTRTYHIDVEKGTAVGMTDGMEAMRQAIYLILCTERFIWPIYSWNYGTELSGLQGKNRFYVEAELERRITEALMQDDRVRSVEEFSFTEKKKALVAAFTVRTTIGDIQAVKEVALDV